MIRVAAETVDGSARLPRTHERVDVLSPVELAALGAGDQHRLDAAGRDPAPERWAAESALAGGHLFGEQDGLVVGSRRFGQREPPATGQLGATPMLCSRGREGRASRTSVSNRTPHQARGPPDEGGPCACAPGRPDCLIVRPRQPHERRRRLGRDLATRAAFTVARPTPCVAARRGFRTRTGPLSSETAARLKGTQLV